MRRLRRFVLRRARPRVPEELRVCVCPIRERKYSVPRDDGTCSRCSGHISPSHDELTRTQGRPIAVVGR